MNFNTGVFEKTGYGSLSERAFYLAMGICLIYGLGGTAYVANLTAIANYQPDLGAILILGLAIPIVGVIIAVKSKEPILSFIGYNMVLIPFGIILGPVLNHYSPNVIAKTFGLTCCITGIMTVLAVSHPTWFENLGTSLFFALTGLVIARVAQIFFPILQHLTIIDWIAAGIFSLYIGYDMHRATRIPRTLDNAVDISLDLYLDILNLFLTLLRLSGDSDD